MKSELNFASFNGTFGTGYGYNVMPVQALPNSKKTERWKKACVDALERQGIEQLHQNIKFRDYRAMTEGRFTYIGTGFGEGGFQELPWFDKEIRKLRADSGVPTYVKHFDFIGIVVNALSGVYMELDDKYRIESIDEYSTNEYIRTKTEMLHKYAQQVFLEEINKMLLMRGIDPQKSDFASQEEADAYQQEIQSQTKALTPPEIEAHLSKNFKVVATEWAQNVLTADKKRFYLEEADRECFVDYLLTGRWFRHYRVGYDSYDIESWRPEETFFSQDVNAKFPQDGEFVGRITSMSTSDILNKYGHLMTQTEQEKISNYWNQGETYYESGTYYNRQSKGVSPMDAVFPKHEIVPFHNYKDHLVNLQLETALGVPLGQTLDAQGNEVNRWLPRQENDFDFSSNSFSSYLRDDITVRRDTVRVTEGYWRSSKRIAVLIHENELGSVSVDIVTDDILSDVLEDKEIKKLRNVSISELQLALKEDRLDEYLNTITYTYIPEAYKFVKIKGNASTIKDDIYLDVRPLDFQIKGDLSNLYDIKLPVAGLIDTGIAMKLEPYQQLHNICMNQITELLEKELGVFFMFDITGLPSEYQDETTIDSLYRIREDIKDTGLVGFDLSRQNTQGNQPNLFSRQEVVYAGQVQYRWELAKQYKQEALSQIGLTPQMLGQMVTAETAEGVKQSVNASHALINHLFDKMNTSKAKAMEIHLAIAQYCEVEGKDKTVLTRKGDGELAFLNILKEDGELFPLRNLGVKPVGNSKDRKMVEMIKNFIVNDNTMQRDMEDVISIVTNPVLVEIQQLAKDIRVKNDKRVAEERQFQDEQNTKTLEAQAASEDKKMAHEKELEYIRSEAKLESTYVQSQARAADKQANTEGYDRVDKAYQNSIQNSFKEAEIGLKSQDLQRKELSDSESKKIELQKLAQKSQELQLKDKALNVQMQTSIINKN